MPTIKDVAREAGVSIATVSYVLNNKHDAVSAETRQQVWEAVRRIGYTPNVTARNLRSSQSRLIGYAWHEVPHDQVNPVLDRFMYFLANAAEASGYHILTFTYSPADPLPAYDELIRSGRVDAFVIAGTNEDDPRVRFLINRGVPFVSFGRANPDWLFSWVDTDGAEGTYQAVSHLIGLGHKRIAFAGWDAASLAGSHRLSGYAHGLSDAHLVLQPELIFRGEQSEASGAEALRTFLQLPAGRRPSAIVAVSDLVAIGVMNEAQRQGLEVGRELSLIGFDDVPLIQYLQPPLTTLRQPVQRIAEHIISFLEMQIASTGDARPVQTELLAPELIVRGSCGPASAG